MSIVFFFSSGRRHTRWPRDWSSDVCSSDLTLFEGKYPFTVAAPTCGPGRSRDSERILSFEQRASDVRITCGVHRQARVGGGPGTAVGVVEACRVNELRRRRVGFCDMLQVAWEAGPAETEAVGPWRERGLIG